MPRDYLQSVWQQLEYYKSQGEKAMSQIPDEGLNWQFNPESNTISIIVKHLWGNMRSRWTDFLTTDGEKEWRQRDTEFEDGPLSRKELMSMWEEGWKTVFDALRPLQESDLYKIVYIRHEPHTVVEAINRQLAHYPLHIGQIIYIAKMVAGEQWQSQSIPKGGSDTFNADKKKERK